MASGQKTQPDRWADVVVGISGQSGPALFIYETKQGVVAEAGLTYACRPPPSVTLGRLDEDSATDLAIIAGDRLYILHGEDEQAAGYGILPDEQEGQLEAIGLPFGVKRWR